MKNVFLFVLIVIVCLLWFYTCNCNKVKVQQIIKVDTVYKQVKGDTSYIPKPYAIYRDTGKTEYVYGTRIERQTIRDTVAVFGDYFSVRLYSDTIKVYNNKKSLGNVIVQDTVTQNQIVGRGFSYNLKIPEVTVTKTLPRNMVFVSMGSAYSWSDSSLYVKAGLSWKFKNNLMITGMAGINTRGQKSADITIHLPIKK
jgi:hypothetical protein